MRPFFFIVSCSIKGSIVSCGTREGRVCIIFDYSQLDGSFVLDSSEVEEAEEHLVGLYSLWTSIHIKQMLRLGRGDDREE